MRYLLLFAALTLPAAALLPVSRAGTLTDLHSLKLEMPASSAMFPAGPGADVINNNCLACHSADHVLSQPSLPEATWEEVVHKMIKAYKAPISPDDAAVIVSYLTRVKGTK